MSRYERQGALRNDDLAEAGAERLPTRAPLSARVALTYQWGRNHPLKRTRGECDSLMEEIKGVTLSPRIRGPPDSRGRTRRALALHPVLSQRPCMRFSDWRSRAILPRRRSPI